MKNFLEPVEKLSTEVQKLARTVEQVQKAKAANNKVGFFQAAGDTSSVFNQASSQLGKVLTAINQVTQTVTLKV